MDASVIIPTYNRAQSLGKTIRSALQLDYPTDRYEIIVVDNASDDNTHERVESLRGSAATHNLHYVREENLGLHYARHAGACAAKGRILLFTDDDASFDRLWLKAYAEAFASHSEMVAAGGPVRPIWEAPPPKWLLDYMKDKKVFGMLSLMEPYEGFRLDGKGYFFGVNMAILRHVLYEVGGFNPELIGSFTVGDGESGLVRKLQEKKWLIGYVPGAVAYHRIPPNRMTLEYLCRWQAHLAGAQLYGQYHGRVPGRLGFLYAMLRTILGFSPIWLLASLMGSKKSRLRIRCQLSAALGYAKLNYLKRLSSDKELQHIVAQEFWLNSKLLDSKIET